jgi:integrase
MSISEIKNSVLKSCFTANYLPAILKEYKSGWIIEYYVENPATHKLERKKIRLTRLVSRYKSTKEARSHANKMVTAINVKLSSGWNPLFSSEDARLYTTTVDVCNAFLKEKEKETREETMRSYSSFVSIFSTWLKGNAYLEYFSMINKNIVVRFMDYAYNERNVSARTYNNYIKIGRALFNWTKEKCYAKENPFDFVKVKPKQEKKRIIIPVEYREIIVNYLNLTQKGKHYLIVLKLIYNALIRPAEIRKLKIENLDLKKGLITVPAAVAKNKKQRIVTLTNDLIEDFKNMSLEQYPPAYYILGSLLMPCKTMFNESYLRKYWSIIRCELKLPKEMQQYSLRDTGMFDMIKNGMDDLSVMQHANHHSLEMTTIYTNHVDPHLAEIIREKSPKF